MLRSLVAALLRVRTSADFTDYIDEKLSHERAQKNGANI